MLREELKMISGIPTEDMDYIGFMLLKDGNFFDNKKEERKEAEKVFPIEGVPDLNTWFGEL